MQNDAPNSPLAQVEVIESADPKLGELNRLRQENALLRDQANRPRSLTELVLSTDLKPEFFRRLATYLILDKKAWDEFMGRCEVIAKANLYGHKTKESVATAALKGMDMGLGFMESLDKIKMIFGTPTIGGPKAKALIDQRVPENKNVCVESTEEKCVWILRRPGKEEKEFTLTFEQVKHLEQENDLWKTYRRRMLKWNCFSEGAQEIYGDVLGDLYLTEELKGAPPAGTTSSRSPQSRTSAPKSTKPKPKKNGLTDKRRESLNKVLHRTTLLMDPDWVTEIHADDEARFRETRKLVYESVCQTVLEFVPDTITPAQAKLIETRLNARAKKWKAVLQAIEANAEAAEPEDLEAMRRELWVGAWKTEAKCAPEPKMLASADDALADKMLAGLAKNLRRIQAQNPDGQEEEKD